MDYKNKYLKYKQKYIYLQQLGGAGCNILFINEISNKHEGDSNLQKMIGTRTRNIVIKKIQQINRRDLSDKFDIIVLSGYNEPNFYSRYINTFLQTLIPLLNIGGIFYILECNEEIIRRVSTFFNSKSEYAKYTLVSDKKGVSYYGGIIIPKWVFSYKESISGVIRTSSSLSFNNSDNIQKLNKMFLESILGQKQHNSMIYDLQTYNFNFEDFINMTLNIQESSQPYNVTREGYSVEQRAYDTIQDKQSLEQLLVQKMLRVHTIIHNEALFSLNSTFDHTNLSSIALKNVQDFKKLLDTPTVVKKPIYNKMFKVEVVELDWYAATIEATKEYGEIFAVLNMADAYIFGGNYKNGAPMQEEDMFRRTNCMDFSHGVNFDGKYRKEMTDLINGVNGTVFLDTNNTRVIIRDSEQNNYKLLDPMNYIPFYELRSASIGGHKTRFTKEEYEKCIRAQFETLKNKNVKCVILSVFQCSEEGCNSQIMARIYNKVIKDYKSHFDKIILTIPTTSFTIFNQNITNN